MTKTRNTRMATSHYRGSWTTTKTQSANVDVIRRAADMDALGFSLGFMPNRLPLGTLLHIHVYILEMHQQRHSGNRSLDSHRTTAGKTQLGDIIFTLLEYSHEQSTLSHQHPTIHMHIPRLLDLGALPS